MGFGLRVLGCTGLGSGFQVQGFRLRVWGFMACVSKF